MVRTGAARARGAHRRTARTSARARRRGQRQDQGLGRIETFFQQIIIPGVTPLLLVGPTGLVNRTQLGRAMRATAADPRVAARAGVRPDRLIPATCAIGAALAAVAAVMWAANCGTVRHTMGRMPGLPGERGADRA
ncbi:MAG: hypothetical protein KGL18_07595 [Burkholderiales bacterium]|nr:hypothetical protein [Burkholderiales bacterium]MDE2160554.1 hypothetical protein [Burkholderiales bacterium]MDE2502823.1 hypothetical protein [Burkholderiales bacterium]